MLSSPTTACDVPNASWIDGISGPIPTICGRSVSAARKSATSVAVGRARHVSERDQRRTLASDPRQQLRDTISWKCGLARCAANAASSTYPRRRRTCLGRPGPRTRRSGGTRAPPRERRMRRTGRHRVALAFACDDRDGEDDGQRLALQPARISLPRPRRACAPHGPRRRAARADRVEQLMWRSAACWDPCRCRRARS